MSKRPCFGPCENVCLFINLWIDSKRENVSNYCIDADPGSTSVQENGEDGGDQKSREAEGVAQNS